jgi:hypothetical protein
MLLHPSVIATGVIVVLLPKNGHVIPLAYSIVIAWYLKARASHDILAMPLIAEKPEGHC